jgi:hypothetical protein
MSRFPDIHDVRRFGWTPGQYYIRCCTCSGQATADKRATSCQTCAEREMAAYNLLSQEERLARYERNLAIFERVMQGQAVTGRAALSALEEGK